MMSAGITLILLFVFSAVFLLGYLVVDNFSEASVIDKQLRQRLTDVVEGASSATRPPPSLLRHKYLQNPSALEGWLNLFPGMASIDRLIEQAGYFFPAYRLVLLSLLMGALVCIAVGDLMPFVFKPLLMVASVWIPISILKILQEKRLIKFEEQLPEALGMITRALRAGHRFNEALVHVAREFPAPLGPEFAITSEELNYGIDIREAFNSLQERVPSGSLKAALTSVLVQRESGGNLAEILTKISTVIRGRFQFQRKVKTLTAEGRMSIWVLALLPFVLFGIIGFSDPDYVLVLIYQPEGRKLLLMAGSLMLIGVVWVNKLLKLDI